MMLKLSGHQVETAYNGTRALQVGESFRPHVTTTVANIAELDETVRKDRKNAEDRFQTASEFGTA